jgi:hypothetical protein
MRQEISCGLEGQAAILAPYYVIDGGQNNEAHNRLNLAVKNY